MGAHTDNLSVNLTLNNNSKIVIVKTLDRALLDEVLISIKPVSSGVLSGSE